MPPFQSQSQSHSRQPTPRAARLLVALARTSPEQTWTLLDASGLARELGLRIADLVGLLRELEALSLVERWPLGSLVYLTEAGRALAAELGEKAA